MGAAVPHRSWVPGTVLLLAVVATVFVLRAHLPLEEWLGPLRSWVGQFGASGVWVLGLGFMVATTVGMPGSLMAIVAGLTLGMGQGMVAAWCGITAGCSLCFLLSRWFFGARVNAFAQGRPRVEAVRDALRRRGWRVLLMLRLTPLVPLVVTNYLAGISGLRFSQAWLAAAVGILPATMVYVGLGAAGSSEPKSSALLVGIGLVATLGLGFMARRILREVFEG